VFVKKKLPEQLGLHCYAVSTHLDELVLEPPSKKSWIRLCNCSTYREKTVKLVEEANELVTYANFIVLA